MIYFVCLAMIILQLQSSSPHGNSWIFFSFMSPISETMIRQTELIRKNDFPNSYVHVSALPIFRHVFAAPWQTARSTRGKKSTKYKNERWILKEQEETMSVQQKWSAWGWGDVGERKNRAVWSGSAEVGLQEGNKPTWSMYRQISQ